MSGEVDAAALAADPRVTWVDDVLRFGDTDLNGHVNNATFSVLAESGRVTMFRTRLGRDDTDPERFWVIAKLTIEFRQELHYPGRVRTATWLARVGRTSLGISQAIFTADGALAATAEAVCVSMARATRRPTELTAEMRGLADALVRA